MANRAIPSISRKSARQHKYFDRVATPITRKPQIRPASQFEISEDLKKSYLKDVSSFYSQIPIRTDQKSFTPNLSPLGQRSVFMPKAERVSTNRAIKLSISFVPRKKENLRYNSQSLEENESFKDLNVVSTPPEEDTSFGRSFSPFSDIIDEPLRNYIENPLPRLGKKLDFKKHSVVEDSGNYSTNESRKRGRKDKGNRWRTPKASSVLKKIANTKTVKIRSRNK